MITLLRFPVPVDAFFRRQDSMDKPSWHRGMMYGLSLGQSTGKVYAIVMSAGDHVMVSRWKPVNEAQFLSAVSGTGN